MGLFSTPKKNVSEREMKDVRSRLRSNGFDDKDVRFVEVVFRADLHESGHEQGGIDEKEIINALSWLRSHPHHHDLSSAQLAALEKILKGEL